MRAALSLSIMAVRQGIHALQIEINAILWMKKPIVNMKFERLRALFSLMLTEIASNLPALPTLRNRPIMAVPPPNK